MADKKISQLTAATTPLAGTEVLPIVQSGSTVKVAVSDLTAGRSISASGATIKSATAYGSVSVDNTGATGGGYVSVKQDGAQKGIIGVSGAVLGSTASDMAIFAETSGQINFYSNGSTTLRAAVETTGNFKLHTGNLVIGTSGKGIDFSATSEGSGTMTSELLADYEEGTWTPIIGGAGGESGQTYTYQYGSYEKIGRTVIARFDVRASVKGTITGNALIKGLPFTASGGNYGYISYWTNMASSIAFMSLQSDGATGAYLLGSLGAVTGLSYLQTANIANGIFLQGTIIYKV